MTNPLYKPSPEFEAVWDEWVAWGRQAPGGGRRYFLSSPDGDRQGFLTVGALLDTMADIAPLGRWETVTG